MICRSLFLSTSDANGCREIDWEEFVESRLCPRTMRFLPGGLLICVAGIPPLTVAPWQMPLGLRQEVLTNGQLGLRYLPDERTSIRHDTGHVSYSIFDDWSTGKYLRFRRRPSEEWNRKNTGQPKPFV